jgi:hypothetical protein
MKYMWNYIMVYCESKRYIADFWGFKTLRFQNWKRSGFKSLRFHNWKRSGLKTLRFRFKQVFTRLGLHGDQHVCFTSVLHVFNMTVLHVFYTVLYMCFTCVSVMLHVVLHVFNMVFYMTFTRCFTCVSHDCYTNVKHM